MSLVKIEDMVESLSYNFKRVLEDAVERTVPEADFDRNKLFLEFKRSIRRKCSTWETVPDRYIKM